MTATSALRLLALSLVALLVASCGPDTKEDFWNRFNALMDEEQGRSNAVFQRSPERRAEAMNDFVTDYYDEFGPMMSEEEKAEFFGKVAVFYMIRSGVLAPSASNLPPNAADSLAHNANQALRELGNLFKQMGEALPDSAQWDSLGQKLQEDIRRRDSLAKPAEPKAPKTSATAKKQQAEKP